MRFVERSTLLLHSTRNGVPVPSMPTPICPVILFLLLPSTPCEITVCYTCPHQRERGVHAARLQRWQG